MTPKGWRQKRPRTHPAARLRGETAISRRDFLRLTGLGTSAVGLGSGCEPLTQGQILALTRSGASATLTRPKDLLFLEFQFVNLVVEQTLSGGQRLVPVGDEDGYIVVHFQPQHILEQALPKNNPPFPPPRPVDARISGPSRLVLKVSGRAEPIPFTEAGLLRALGALEMSVAPNALPPDPTKPNTPQLAVGSGIKGILQERKTTRSSRLLTFSSGVDLRARGSVADTAAIVASPKIKLRPRLPLPTETALELPFRLILSPNERGGWVHNQTADQGLKLGRHELWHTRLGVRDQSGAVSEAPSYLRAVRAVWSRDPSFKAEACTNDKGLPEVCPWQADEPFEDGLPTSLNPLARAEIVHLSSNFHDLQPYKPRAIETQRLMLSALGGALDARADFTGSPLVLKSWDHEATLGRDHYVKLVHKGRLFPWGHFAPMVTITERKFQLSTGTPYLVQKNFVLLRELIRTYPASWRRFPFKSIHVKTMVTPSLSNVPGGDLPSAIELADGTPFRFKMEAEDREGNIVHFDAPASWVPESGTVVAGGAADIYQGYGAARFCQLNGQRLAYAPSDRPDDTSYETEGLLIAGAITKDQDFGIPGVKSDQYGPALAEAKLGLEGVRHLAGPTKAATFEYSEPYLESGLPPDDKGKNPGALLFQLKDQSPVDLSFADKSDRSGGFVAPRLQIRGISRRTGPVSASSNDQLANTVSGGFDPAQYLPDAMIFGVIPLSEIIGAVDLAGAPRFMTQSLDVVSGFLEDATLLAGLLGDKTAKVTLETKVAPALAAVSKPGDIGAAVAQTTQALDQLLMALQSDTDALPAATPYTARQDVDRRLRSLQDRRSAVDEGLFAFGQGKEMATSLTTRLEWRAPLKSSPGGFFVPVKEKSSFLLSVEARAKQIGNKPAGVDVVAGIENFDVHVFGSEAKLITIPFERLVFKVESGKKADVDVVFRGGIGFDGVLGFVQTLASLLPSQGFSDPPALEVDAEGIRSSFNLPIPSISVGVFSIQNISIGAGFEVPFIGNPLSVCFNFCTRDEPFILTVLCVGGGGFFGVKLCPTGLLLLEAALEARAQLAIDLGVASGSVSLAVGVYFRLEQKGSVQEGSLTGYIRIQGEVDVLGLITASIMLLLELTYEFASQKLLGRATIHVEVSVAFFSATVEVTCERKLAGSNQDPTFVDQMGEYTALGPVPSPAWTEYLESFVLAAA